MKASYFPAGCASLSPSERQLWSVQVSAIASMMRHQSQSTTAALHYDQALPAVQLPNTALSLSMQPSAQCQSVFQPQPIVSASYLPAAINNPDNLSLTALTAVSGACPAFESHTGQPPAKRPALEKLVTTTTLLRDNSEPGDVCKVCCASAKSGKDYCKSCYGVLYKHIKQIIETIHRDGTKFITGGTRTETLERLRHAILKTKQRTRRQCEGKIAVAHLAANAQQRR